MIISPDFESLLSASREAALREQVDEGLAAKALAAIRSAAENRRLFQLWDAIDEQIGKTENPNLRQVLFQLRARAFEELFTAELGRLKEICANSPDAGWREWLTILAESVTLFRMAFATRLCEESLAFLGSKKQVLDSIGNGVRFMSQNRWPEAYEHFEYLANQDFLPQIIRAKLFVLAGQILLFHFEKDLKAKEFFEFAEKLATNDGIVSIGLGDYWIKQKEFEKGTSYFKRAIELDPKTALSYVRMGQYFEGSGDLQQAAEWYRRAIQTVPGKIDGYENLLKLYGRPELFQEHERDLKILAEQAIAVGPEDKYQIYCALAEIYKQKEQFESAHEWYERAIALDDTRPEGYVALAQCFEAQGQNDRAESAYKMAIEVAPECYDGYWGLTWLYERQEKWEQALNWYNKVPVQIREWASIARARAGEMYSKLQNYPEAEDILRRELRINKENHIAKNILERIADDYYQKRNDVPAARRIYTDILKVLGDSYNGSYHNRLGNMYYFFREDLEAAEEYRRAIAAESQVPIYHRNLALVCRRLRRYREAERELETAFAIDKDQKTHNREMALLRNAEANDLYAQGDYRAAADRYEEAVRFDPNDAVIQSNLGGAWKKSLESGRKIQALDKALQAFTAAYTLNKASDQYRKEIETLKRKKEFASSYGEKALDWIHVVTPLAVEVANNLIPVVEGRDSGTLSDELLRRVTEMRARIENEFGVKLPGVRFRGSETDFSDGVYVILLMETSLVSGRVPLDKRFCPVPGKGEPAVNPITRESGSWVAKEDWSKTGDFDLWEPLQYLVSHIETVVRRNLNEFFGHQEVANLLVSAGSDALASVKAQSHGLSRLTSVCRALLAEGVSVKPFAEIRKALGELEPQSVSLTDMVEKVRSLPELRTRLPGNDGQHSILPLGPRLEADLLRSIYRKGPHAVLAMEPERCQDALAAIRNGIGGEQRAALLVENSELRPFLRLLTELEFPAVPVLSRRELGTNLPVSTAQTIEIDEDRAASEADFQTRKSAADRAQTSHAVQGLLAGKAPTITVFVHRQFAAEGAAADDQPISDMFALMRDGLFYELGIVLPEVRLKFDETLEPNEFRFEINGRSYRPIAGLSADEFLVNDSVERLKLLSIEGKKQLNPANRTECTIVRVRPELLATCRQAGLTTWGPAGFLVLSLSAEIRKNAASFQTLAVTEYILHSLSEAFPDLIETVLARFSVEQICLVLRDLLAEEISIRDLVTILESMLSVNGTTDIDLNRYIVLFPRGDSLCAVAGNKGLADLTAHDYSNFVRTCLKRYISHKYSKGANTLVAYLLDAHVERRIANSDSEPLTSDEQEKFDEAVRRELAAYPARSQNPVLLTTMDIRKTVREMIEAEWPALPVLSHQELSPDTSIQPIARISWT